MKPSCLVVANLFFYYGADFFVTFLYPKPLNILLRMMGQKHNHQSKLNIYFLFTRHRNQGRRTATGGRQGHGRLRNLPPDDRSQPEWTVRHS